MKHIIARCGYRCDLCPAYIENITCLEDKERLLEIRKTLNAKDAEEEPS